MTSRPRTPAPQNAVHRTMLDQIGRMNVLAISGGRVVVLSDTCLRLPVRYGYHVEIEYQPWSDTYEVRRVLIRSGILTVKAMLSGIHADMLSDRAYRASCFRGPVRRQP